MSGNPIVFADSEGGVSVRLHRKGKKRYELQLAVVDATWGVESEQNIALRFGLIKAREAAKAYWEMYKIQKGRV